MEKKYIEQEVVKDKLSPTVNDPNAVDFWEWQCSLIDEIPAADVREVVLCKNCIHNKGQKEWPDGDITADCSCGMGYPPLGFFCAYGERPNCGADMRNE